MAGKPVYRFEGIELDPGQGCLRRQGQEHHPRAKVYQMLVYLLDHRDRLVTKQELIEHLWRSSAVTDDVVFHCVTEIRTLLGDSREHPRFLRTYPSVGYRFIATVEEVWAGNGAATAGEKFPADPLPPSRRGRTWPAAMAVVVLCGAWAGSSSPWRGANSPDVEVAWWRFDDRSGRRARDSSGYGNVGSLAGNPRWIEGRLGGALAFEGVDSSVGGQFPARSLPQGSAPRTVTAWIRTRSTNGDITNIFQYGAAPARTFRLGLRADGRVSAGRPSMEVAGTSRLDDGAWHFVAAAYEGAATNQIRVFVDGVREAEEQWRERLDTRFAATGSARESPWRIGRHVDAGTPFRGAIDDVRVFARALGGSWLRALQRCSSGVADVRIGGSPFYYLPVFPGNDLRIGSEGEIRNVGDLGGVQFARPDGVCAVESLRGADVGQDLRISAEIRVPPQAPGEWVSAGPYFRSRAAAPGDGVIGGTSAGYSVELDSTGVVRVRRLNPHQIVAFTAAAGGFDASRYHRLEVTVEGGELEVELDGSAAVFDQGGRTVRTVSIPPGWDGPPRTGRNQGAAGIGFLCEPRGKGGQEVRNVTVGRVGR